MFVLVKQERFATVSVGIFEAVVPCFYYWNSEWGDKSVCLYEGNMLFFRCFDFFIIIIVNVLFLSQEILL